MAKIFPKGFLWGTSTASHQVEGGTVNQWSEWELAHAQELAKTAEQRLGYLASWKQIRDRAEDPDNYVSGEGVDHYKRYKDDFKLARAMGTNAFRFGIEWSRIEPVPGSWDKEVIQHYHDYIRALRAEGLEPLLNLWHWTLPTWFAEAGGFKNRKNLRHWRRFVQMIADEFGREVKYIVTLNEPNVYTTFSYTTGEWVPQEKNVISTVRVALNLVSAHRMAYKILKKKNAGLQIGVASQLANIQAKRPHNVIDEIVTSWMRYAWNWWFLNRIKRQQDFVGFNYYFTDYYKGVKRQNPSQPINDLGWYMEPEGLYPLLTRVWAHYKKPIIVTENGLADESDEFRSWWIEETFVALERALSEGVDVRGYFHWSLLDNFEWKYGWWPKFGLIAIDRRHNMKRTPRASALAYRDAIKKVSKN